MYKRQLYAASFDSTRIELQFLNLYGRVDNSTQGVAAGTAPQLSLIHI